MIMGFIDAMRAEGHAVESICRVLSEQGCQVAARTYRAWKSPTRVVAARNYTDAVVIDAIHAACTRHRPRRTAAGDSGEPVRAAEDDGLPAPQRSPRDGPVHRRPGHDRPGHARGPAGQGDLHHRARARVHVRVMVPWTQRRDLQPDRYNREGW